MIRSRFSGLLAASAFALATFVSTSAQAGPYSGLVVFGDSLSDSGNNFLAGLYDPTQVISGNSYVPSYTYAPNGTYSNGPVWATYFASILGVPLAPSLGGGSNFAFGGATTGTPGSGAGGFPYSLRVQAGQYLGATGNVASPDALYVVAGGGNNARAALTAIGGGADLVATATATATAFAADVGDIVDDLQAAGAQHIVVWNTPNLGLVPAVAAGGPLAIGAGSFVAQAMNTALTGRLSLETGVTTFDIFGFGSMFAANPGAFGFTNVTDACGAVAGADCSEYAYWDGIHPTTAAHRVLANAMAAAALPVPEPETYALFAIGLVAVALRSRRRTRKSLS
jgi:outer membrane lipase/esterase